SGPSWGITKASTGNVVSPSVRCKTNKSTNMQRLTICGTYIYCSRWDRMHIKTFQLRVIANKYFRNTWYITG
ncbi:unnamed protein product, partial [Choristocarpus tenellus]